MCCISGCKNTRVTRAVNTRPRPADDDGKHSTFDCGRISRLLLTPTGVKGGEGILSLSRGILNRVGLTSGLVVEKHNDDSGRMALV